MTIDLKGSSDRSVMVEPLQVKPKEFFILGLTSTGQVFRPSDWAERLCGILSCYRPQGRQNSQQHLVYSPYAQPTVIDGIRCVVIDERLRDIEPMAMNFVFNFVKDNDLELRDICMLPTSKSY